MQGTRATQRKAGTTTLSSRNQITLPASIVRAHGFEPGARLLVEDFGDSQAGHRHDRAVAFLNRLAS